MPAVFIRAEFKFDPPEDAEPIPVTRPTRAGTVIAQIHPRGTQLRVVVHHTVGVIAELVGPAVHERTGKPNPMIHLTEAWTPEGRGHHRPIDEAPQWVRDAYDVACKAAPS